MDSNNTHFHELWIDIKKGDKKALSCLYEIYADALYRFGTSFTSDSHFIEDCIHDLFVEIYIRRKKLPTVINTKNYLFTILRRKITKQFKNRNIIISSQNDFKDIIYLNKEISIEAKTIFQEEKEELELALSNALLSLTPKQKKVVTMRFFKDKSYEEIASTLNISITTARTLIYRSIKALRKNIA
tara:strand:+ start:73270 stop:73827 length:558 start_codon:yes stop_codon:yes gene_type:complete